MSMKRYVLVTTSHRGVFFGRLVEDRIETVVLAEARNCLYWSKETRGFLGLASTGPQGGSKVGPAVPTLTLYGVTCLADCTEKARVCWEAGPWT